MTISLKFNQNRLTFLKSLLLLCIEVIMHKMHRGPSNLMFWYKKKRYLFWNAFLLRSANFLWLNFKLSWSQNKSVKHVEFVCFPVAKLLWLLFEIIKGTKMKAKIHRELKIDRVWGKLNKKWIFLDKVRRALIDK